MRRKLFKLWTAAQPFLKVPRRWVALGLRKLLWRTTFIAITGSNGKTTATQFLAAILSSVAPTQWTRLNRNSQGGITETIAFCHPWKTRFAVFEVGAGKPGAVEAAAQLIRPKISVVLSVFLEHRTFLKSLEGVAREKALLLRHLPQDGLAVLNADDPYVAGMPVPDGCRMLKFGTSPGCDAYYENATSAWPQLLKFTAVVNGQRQEIRSRLLGIHWVGPILACISVAHQQGIPLGQIARVIEDVPPYPGRMQAVRLPSGAVVIRDEFKGSQHTIDVAFDELRKARADRKFLVFGDVADSSLSPRKRLEKTGKAAAEIFDYVLFIGSSAHHGVRGALKGGVPGHQAFSFSAYAEAAEFLGPKLKAGDVVLIKAGRNQQLTRLFYSLLGEVRCTIPVCDKSMVCDECPEFQNPGLVQLANGKLTAKVE